MKKYILIILIFKFVFAKAQIDSNTSNFSTLIKIEKNDFLTKSNDTLVKKVGNTKYFFDGIPDMDVIEKTGKLYKCTYFQNGELKSICKITIQIKGVDNYTFFSDSSFERIINHYFDFVYNGNFVEYDENKKIRSKGSYKKGYKIGIWKYYDKNEKIIKKIKYQPYTDDNQIEYNWKIEGF